MRKVRIYCEQNIIANQTIDLSAYNAKHLVKVLRKKIGDTVFLFNENDGEWECEITLADKKNVSVKAVKFIRINNMDVQIDLYFSPVKNPDSTWVVQKATELGAKNIYPFISDHSVVKSVNLDKLTSSINDATQQSERTDMPQVSKEMTFRELQKIDYDLVLFFDESGKGKGPNVLSEIIITGKIAVIIGNEGGFTELEREEIYRIPNCVGVSLPKLILRAETAIVSALTLVQNYLGVWKS